ncbi:MAG: glucose-1-phosphate adenylyltransferase subunit GlgD [Oscillospiraceae bacterium]|nr:glucose-1-phosphate adenylyltransferase subunit GlgD [Oscillospiraceae bacterium]
MRNYHGIIFAYHAQPELRELTAARTAASLPFCGRYRLIDFPLSSMRNAGILNVGIIMQRDYQSLLDHIGSGKAWDMSRKSGGIRMLPPFGLPEYHTGDYNGTVEALNAVSTYIRDIEEDWVVLMLGSLCANVDLQAVISRHEASGADATAICADHTPMGVHHRYVLGEDGFVERIALYRTGESEGVASLEGYIIGKDKLVELMDRCRAENLYLFHRDAMTKFLGDGCRMGVYIHPGYANAVRTVEQYYKASMDMLRSENRRQLFPANRPVRTKEHEEVSTYYGEHAAVHNSLVADNCIIEGEVENCILFSGVRIEPGAKLHDCIVMRGCEVGEGVELDCVIADKFASFAPGVKLVGSPKLPTVVPKRTKI